MAVLVDDDVDVVVVPSLRILPVYSFIQLL